jgi:acyl-CoA oxidase
MSEAFPNAPIGSGGTSHMLPAERKRASFDVTVLMDVMGTAKRRKQLENAQKIFSEGAFDPRAEDHHDYDSYETQYVQQVARTAAAVQLTRDNPSFMFAHMAGKVQMQDLFDTNGLAAIHFTMYLTFLTTNGNKEQKARWLDGATDGSYFGAYAQTELGHGSNVRGLETQAAFDSATDEFVIHSPTLTSMKWWPTGMYACTHAVVFAELRIGGVAHGVHGFMVQLRDEGGRLMPGVEVGEIGPKIIGGHTNIGYARFDRVRIPRFNMFSKLFRVTRAGEFIAPPPKQGKIKNISMMMMRVANVAWAARDTAKAAVIAVRYSCVRVQGFKDTVTREAGGGGRGENTIMDYRMQQLRTLSALSLAYMFFWNARYLQAYLGKVQSKIKAEDAGAADELPELHATCSGLKSFSTTRGHAAIEECRKACGGQGFLRSSGIADLACSFAEPVTVEGEQVILSLQVARFLIKSVRAIRAGEPVKGSVEYLKEPALTAAECAPAAGWAGQHALLVRMLRDRASRKAVRLEARFGAALLGGASFDEATNAVAVAAYEAAMCHSAYVMARNNLLAIEEFVPAAVDAPCRAALMRLLELRALLFVREDAADWMGLLTAEALEEIFDRVCALLLEIRPDAVALCDAFGYTDYSLGSTLGRHDGNVYEAIYNEAKLSPLNKSPIMVGWDELKPILDLDFIKAGVGQRWEPAAKL